MGDYILLLSNGDFVSIEQTTECEVEIIPTTYYDAMSLPTLDEAMALAKGINERKDGKFTVYSDYNVVRILKNYSIE